MHSKGTLILTRSEVATLMTFDDYIIAVEQAFRAYAEGGAILPSLLHIETTDGEFHIKSGGLKLSRLYVAVKVNGGFFGNMKRFGLPNIQGMISLYDGETGFPLACMDSTEITVNRTGALTALAARYLARSDSSVATICGCGRQGRIQLVGLKHVRPLKTAFAFDRDTATAEAFAEQMSRELGLDVRQAPELRIAVEQSDIVVTCTPSKQAFLDKDTVRPGTFISAVGADSPSKQELDPRLMVSNTIVVDILEQCATVGELHHAIDSGLVTRRDVHAELADVIVGRRRGRSSRDEVIVFDTTGTALQDVSAAAAVYERAMARGVGHLHELSS